MKTLILCLSLLCSHQLVNAQSSFTSPVKHILNYELRTHNKELQLKPSYKVKTFYNLHIVRNFPTLFAATAEKLSVMDDTMVSESDILEATTANVQKDKSILKNIAWTNTQQKKH
jgi:hypothetical protein